jgi:hypothetical protein
VANDLDNARQLVKAGKDKKALEVLWTVEAPARTDKQVAEALLQLASEIRDRSGGRVRSDAESLVGHANDHLAKPDAPPPDLFALRPCSAVSCDLPVDAAAIQELAFTNTGIALRGAQNGPELGSVPYPEITDLEIVNAPRNPTKKRIGRGAGRAALGLTISSLVGGGAGWNAADKILSFHRIYVTIRTSEGEVVVEHRSGTPLDRLVNEQLIPVLEPLLERVRTATAEAPSASQEM